VTILRKRAVATVLVWTALGASAWACPVCFRMEDGPVSDGVRAAVVVLLGVTTTVLAGFAVFIRGFIKRAGDLADAGDVGEARRSSDSEGGSLGTLERL
jgi:hypothetical protein